MLPPWVVLWVRQIKGWAVRLEGWYFDKHYKIETRASAEEDLSAESPYLPTRPNAVRRLLRELPLTNYADYIFLDIGSGKGRVLLLASEYPFREVVGVELRKELHELAVQNIDRRPRPTRQSPIQLLNMDARDYVFPDENLVLYIFNPFGREIMKELLNRLDASLERSPRDVLLILFYPEQADLVEAIPRLQLHKQFGQCRFYRSAAAS